MSTIMTKMGEGGRVIVPAEMRKKFQLRAGETISFTDTDDGLVLATPKMALERLRRRLREVVPQGVSLADELIAERRKEAENE